MQKTVSKEQNTFTAPEQNSETGTNVLIKNVRRSIAVALATIAGGYFLALCVLVGVLTLPILMLRKLKNHLSASE